MNEHDQGDSSVHVDFTLVSDIRAIESAQSGLCGLCANELDPEVAFLGGLQSMFLRTYGDPPMHEACAIAALTLCPHLAIQRHNRPPRDSVYRKVLYGPKFWTDQKPDQWFLGVTRDFRLFRINGYAVFLAFPFDRVRTFGYDEQGHVTEQWAEQAPEKGDDMDEARRSIKETRMAEADPQVIRDQLGAALRTEISARNLIGMEDGLMFHFGPAGTKLRKMFIKLNGLDLYEVEVGYTSRSTGEWTVVGQESDVHVEALRASVRKLAAKGVDA
ncbi:hypothetical protein [Amycolatopsis sp. lyj-84]|uniref:hypothetical protein n=1 Tax=Amycolatopsis sp. lyj-84 TaxID=2789284 RepID=UPI003977FEB8